MFLSSCAYTNFSVAREKYQQSEHVTNAKQVTKEVLRQEGYDIKRANWQVVETKPASTFIVGYGYQVEFKTWIKVFLDANRIKTYCSQATTVYSYEQEKPKKCTDKWMLGKLDSSVKSIVNRLSVGL
jgi:hypothetical protein